jgi:hypothetical protein
MNLRKQWQNNGYTFEAEPIAKKLQRNQIIQLIFSQRV